MLGPKHKLAILKRSGEVVQWWATFCEGDPLPYVTVVGRQAVVFAVPAYNSEHQPQYVCEAGKLDPGSFQETSIDHRPPRPERRRRPQAAQPTSHPADTLVKGLDAKTLGVLGNLPPRVQQWMQAPFLTSEIRRCDWYWEGRQDRPDRRDPFCIVFVGAKHMILATGTKLIPYGYDDASAHWSLKCYLAKVTELRLIPGTG